MLNINYIIIGALPRRERDVLKENLLRDSEGKWRLTELFDWKKRDNKKFNFDLYIYDDRTFNTNINFELDGESGCLLPDCPPEESLLVSGDAAQLEEAQRLGMATVCCLSDEEERSPVVEWGMTETKEAACGKPDMYVEGFEEVGLTFLCRVYERHHEIPWTICETKRCVIKEFSMEYLDALFALYAGEGMTDYMEPLYDYERERKYQEAYISHMYRFYGYGMWIVCERGTGRLLGRAGVEPREELDGEPELGYAIGTPYQRQGYAREVCEAIIDYVRRELEYPRLNCLIEEGNTVSERLAKRLGFVFLEWLPVGKKRMKRYVLDLRCIL